jgi:hypothetical protein
MVQALRHDHVSVRMSESENRDEMAGKAIDIKRGVEGMPGQGPPGRHRVAPCCLGCLGIPFIGINLPVARDSRKPYGLPMPEPFG